MRKLLITTIILVQFVLYGISQEEKQLANRDGVSISYQLILEEQGKKKDKYLMIVNAENNSDKDLYYDVQLEKDDEGNWHIATQTGFSKIKIRNSNTLFSNELSVKGDMTELITTNNAILYEVKKGNIYSSESTFKVKTGDKPLITNTFLKRLKSIEEYDIKVNSKMLEGNYISNCGNLKINISFEKASEETNGVERLRQTSNGKQFIWIRKSETTFVRDNNPDLTLTFNKKDGSYTYSTTDGITCIWSKE